MISIQNQLNKFSVNNDVKHSYSNEVEQKIDSLFRTLFSIFTASKHQFDSDTLISAKAVWVMALTAHCDETGELIDIKNGVSNACKSTSPFFPSVGQFIEMCNQFATDEQAERAYFDFVRNICRMDFLFIETKKVCAYDARRLFEKESKILFLKTYKDVAKKYKVKVNQINYQHALEHKIGVSDARKQMKIERKNMAVGAPSSVLDMLK